MQHRHFRLYKIRLNKYLAQAGVASRREADLLIRAATTTVNGIVITDPAYQVMPTDEVVYDGRRLKIDIEPTVVMLNKPKGVITTVRDPQNRPTVLDLIPGKTRLFPIGRLDKDTTGLILLTNDGELANFLLHPRHQIPRIYVCEIEGRLSSKMIAKLSRGIFIGGGEFGRCQVLRQNTVKKRSRVTLELTQGKKREIRRIFSALRVRLFTLHRIQYGPIKLGKLPEGRWRSLTTDEIASLRKLRKRKGKIRE